jgi:hypothetical protein
MLQKKVWPNIMRVILWATKFVWNYHTAEVELQNTLGILVPVSNAVRRAIGRGQYRFFESTSVITDNLLQRVSQPSRNPWVSCFDPQYYA